MAIEVLSQDVVNQIAAGEVLERPANLVKELVENAIDAGSTEIEIDLDLGGRYLKIQDNGHGMNREDLLLALGRHSTSKIRKFSDLWSLQTYGFRGEALASTAAVSEMSIVTRPTGGAEAFQITSKFGEQGDVNSVSGNFGTRVVVDNLFQNVPARLKFLKSDAAEVTQTMKVIKAFALSHPEVAFRFKQKNVLKSFYPATTSALERAKTVLGVSELFEVSSSGSIKVHGIFSSPQEVTKTSQHLWIFAQKRWIQDRGLQKAIMDSYRNLLMHGEYPYCVMFLECDPQAIDVNIHPTKSQVKFQDPSQAFRAVHNTLREGLEKGPWLKNLFEEGGVQGAVENFSQNYSAQEISPSYDQSSFSPQTASFTQTVYPQKTFAPQMPSTTPSAPMLAVSSDPLWGSLQILGQLNLTYILAQSRQALFLVDQHAAHERVAFERLMKSFRDKKFEVQTYLLPLQMDLEPDAFETLMSLAPELKKMSIDIEAAGPTTISVNAAPSIVKEKAILEILQKMSKDAMENGGSYSLEKKIGDIFATMACHSVIRAGQALSNEEMKELLEQMDESPLSSFCPHGRPVFKQITFRELDKEFGRIV